MLSKNSPLVSVIIPCYNHEKFVQETILSIINQDYKNIELIIIDDGSKDNSLEKIIELSTLCENRFHRFEIRSRTNVGLTRTLNEALNWCNGNFISPIASDDGWHPSKISTQVEFLLSNPDIPACCTNIEVKGSNASKSIYAKSTITFYTFTDIFLFRYHLPAPTFMLNKSNIKFWPIYSENYYSEDLYLFLKLTSTGQVIACLPEILGFYRRHPSNTSSLEFKKLGEDRMHILNEYRENDLWKVSTSISLLIQATQTLSIKKLEGIKLMFNAIKINLSTFFTKRFIRFIIYLLMPKKLIKIKLGIKR